MKNKKKFGIIIHISYWLIIMGSAIIELFSSLIKNNSEFNVNMIGREEYLSWVFLFVFFCIVSIFKMFYLSLIYIIYSAKRIANRRHYKEKLDKIDFKNDNYYREIISEFSPGVLSYIDNFRLDEKDIVGTLMSLQIKNKISILDEIELIDIDEKDLDENEIYILENIKNNNLKNINIRVFEQKVINDCIKNKLLLKSDNVKRKILGKILICILLILMVYNLPMIFSKIQFESNIVTVLFSIIMFVNVLAMFWYPIATIIYIITYGAKIKSNPFVRSKSAQDINSKLEGLKKYIKEYSLLDKREYREVEIWEDYMIYSVTSGQNQAIVKEIMKKIK